MPITALFCFDNLDLFGLLFTNLLCFSRLLRLEILDFSESPGFFVAFESFGKSHIGKKGGDGLEVSQIPIC